MLFDIAVLSAWGWHWKESSGSDRSAPSWIEHLRASQPKHGPPYWTIHQGVSGERLINLIIRLLIRRDYEEGSQEVAGRFGKVKSLG